jgi:hypothetical protein
MKVFNEENAPSMNGSGLAGYIDTTYNKLVSVLGEATFNSPSGDSKVQVEWVLKFEDKLFSIYDWKRAKNITRINQFNKFALPPQICHLPDSNFWHYALQLNTYKAIIEQKYGKIVKDLFLVRLHPDAEEKNYELIKLPDLSVEIKDLFEERKKQL